ncbi:MAG TPA: serine hydrolase [Steroidobacteraceae bacterium]|nr:serine hydrolase [Steroidobacteraceae bacterium]
MGVLVLLCWPFVNRSAPASRPVPMPELPMTNPRPLVAFIETRAEGIDAFVVHKNGAVIFSYGQADVPMNLASARKSVLSLLYGIAWDRGLIKLSKALGELGIDESATPLTQIERQATIEQLLQARSGVYLPADAETPEMKAARPKRGQYAPGEHFYYNNWDFNVLGAIFEKETGMRIGDALDQWLAQPLGMEDFSPSHVYFGRREGTTDFPAYRMNMSARDLARLGTLVLQKGEWKGTRIVSEAWLNRSFAASSTFATMQWGFSNNAYGYSWWLNTDNGAVVADGWGGQYLYVDRANNMVVVARRDMGNSSLGFLWFSQFKKPGNQVDVMTLRELALQQPTQ